MSKIEQLKTTLKKAQDEARMAEATGTAAWDDALDFAYLAMELMPFLLRAEPILRAAADAGNVEAAHILAELDS